MAFSSSASSAATFAACASRAWLITSSIGPDRSECSSFAARDTAAAGISRPFATHLEPFFSSACHSPSAVPVTVRISSTVRVFFAVDAAAAPFGRPRFGLGASSAAGSAEPSEEGVDADSAVGPADYLYGPLDFRAWLDDFDARSKTG